MAQQAISDTSHKIEILRHGNICEQLGLPFLALLGPTVTRRSGPFAGRIRTLNGHRPRAELDPRPRRFLRRSGAATRPPEPCPCPREPRRSRRQRPAGVSERAEATSSPRGLLEKLRCRSGGPRSRGRRPPEARQSRRRARRCARGCGRLRSPRAFA